MSVQYVSSIPTLGKLYGAYSPASRSTCEETFSIAGQLGALPDGSLPGDGGVAAQVKQAFANLQTVLSHLNLNFNNILRFNTYLVGRESLPPFMSARLEVFETIYPEGLYPPNTLVLVSGLVEEQCLVEIEALATH